MGCSYRVVSYRLSQRFCDDGSAGFLSVGRPDNDRCVLRGGSWIHSPVSASFHFTLNESLLTLHEQLWEWKQAIRERLSALRLNFHETSAQVIPTTHGIPWLGFVIFPEHRRVKRRKVVEAHSRLTSRFDRWQRGEISFAEFDASVQGWVNHVRYADSWGLRRHVLQDFIW